MMRSSFAKLADMAVTLRISLNGLWALMEVPDILNAQLLIVNVIVLKNNPFVLLCAVFHE
jgi:hypothetical protein